MATIHWTNNAGGNWSNAGNWSSNPALPNSTSDVLIDATPAPYTVSVNGGYTVDSIGVIAGVTVTTTYGNAFTVTGANAASSNAGTITVANYSDLYFGGSIANSGLIDLVPGGNNATLHINSAMVTLSGGGNVTLADSTNAYLRGGPANKLVNVNNTISGGGSIGLDGLVIDNQAAGIIDATGVNAAMVVTGTGTITNEGLIEATNTAGLLLRNVSIGNTGTIQGVGGTVALQNATITGGTMAGSVQTSYGYFNSVLNGSVNNGTVTVTNYSALGLLGAITNNATIDVSAAANNATLSINSNRVTLQGAGDLNLGDDPNVQVTGAGTVDLLINAGNVISGAGQFGDGQLNVDNHAGATIDATGANALVINAGSYASGGVTKYETFTNEGLLEATNPGSLATTGGLVIYGTTIDSTHATTGKIEALGTNTHVDLQHGATIKGGTLVTGSGDVITTDYGNSANVDGSTQAVTLAAGSVLRAANYTTLNLLGSIVNDGTIFDASANNATYLVVASPTLTLTGGGLVSLNDEANGNAILQAGTSGDKLVNVNNTIAGAGSIGANGMVIDNQASGIINENGVNHSLVLLGSSGFTNEGLIESTSASDLEIRGITISNTGKIQGVTGGTALLENSTIAGGTLAGAIATTYGTFSNTLDGSSGGVTNTGTISVVNYSQLNLIGSIINKGVIADLGTANTTYVTVDSAAVTLSGGGLVTLNDNTNGNAVITAATSSDLLTNVDNTISGAGSIGGGGLAVDNQASGVIDANGVNHSLVLTASTGFTNEGLIEATATGGLEIRSIGVTNTGIIQGVTGGTIFLENSTIADGTLAGAVATVYGDFSNVLDGSSGGIASTGTISIVNYSALNLVGTFTNKGTVADLATANTSYLTADSPTVTLTGGGSVSLNDNTNGNAVIDAAATGDKLVNVNNTISGAGTIGGGGLVLDNQAAAIIDASGVNHSLVLTGSTGFTNEGLLETTSVAGLEIRSIALTNTGTIQGVTGGTVTLENSTISGGKLNGAFATAYSDFSNVLDGTAGVVTNNGTVAVVNYSGLTLAGTIINTGLISDNATSNGSYIYIGNGTTTLTGAGMVSLADTTNAILTGAVATSKLVNAGNTISGGGLFGNGSLVLDNQAAGVIDATTPGGMTISLSGAFTNEGLVEATGTGGLVVQNATLTNTGTILANGGNTTLAASVGVTNIAGGTLTGGAWAASGATLAVAAGPVSTDAATITLSGTLSPVTFGGVVIDASLTTIAASGVLNLLAGRNFTATNAITDNGSITLGGGTLNVSSLKLSGTGKLSGFGSVTDAVTNSGTITSNGGLLTLATGATGLGALIVSAASTLELAANTTAGTVTDSGVLQLDGKGYSFNAFNVTSAGAVDGSGTLSKAFTNVGRVEAKAGTLALSAGATGAGTLQSDAGANLYLVGGTDTAGTVIGNGTVQLAGASLTATTVSLASTGKIYGKGTVAGAVANAGVVEASGGTLTLSGVVTGAGRLQADAGATLELGATTSSGAVTDKGVLKLDGSTYTFSAATVYAGASLVGTGTVATAVSSSGTIEATTGLLKLASGASGSGTLLVDATGTMELGGNTTAATVTDNGVLQLDGKTYTFTALSVVSGATLVGSGVLAKAFTNAGLLEAKTGTTVLTLGATGTGTIQNDAGATLNLAAGTDTAGSLIANGTVLLSGASLTATTLSVGAAGYVNGKGTLGGPITNNGKIYANVSGLLDVTGAVTGSGHFAVLNGATLELGGATAQGVVYGAGAATLRLDAPASYTGAISGLAIGDAINFSSETVSSAVVNGSTLTVVGSAGTTTYAVSGTLTGNHFAVQPDQHTIVLTSGAALALARAAFVTPAATPPTTTSVTTAATTPTLHEITGLGTLPSQYEPTNGGLGSSVTPDTHISGLALLDTTQHTQVSVLHPAH